MTVAWALTIALATGLLCGWLARWQWDRRHWDEWGDIYDRWDRS